MKKKRWMNRIVAVITVVVLIIAVFIMAQGLGLVDSLDFGAGAYYYADMPGFEKFVNGASFSSIFPMWFHIALFLAWGYLMFKVWNILEKKWGKKEPR